MSEEGVEEEGSEIDSKILAQVLSFESTEIQIDFAFDCENFNHPIQSKRKLFKLYQSKTCSLFPVLKLKTRVQCAL